MPDASMCPGCGEDKSNRRRLCNECVEKFGTVADNWPDWLREMVNSMYRWRYADLQASEYEIPLGDIEPYDGMEVEYEDQLWTRPRSEMGLSTGSEAMALPFAPYDDEEMNREYRKSNGITVLPIALP